MPRINMKIIKRDSLRFLSLNIFAKEKNYKFVVAIHLKQSDHAQMAKHMNLPPRTHVAINSASSGMCINSDIVKYHVPTVTPQNTSFDYSPLVVSVSTLTAAAAHSPWPTSTINHVSCVSHIKISLALTRLITFVVDTEACSAFQPMWLSISIYKFSHMLQHNTSCP